MVRYASRVVIYDRKMFIRLATAHIHLGGTNVNTFHAPPIKSFRKTKMKRKAFQPTISFVKNSAAEESFLLVKPEDNSRVWVEFF